MEIPKQRVVSFGIVVLVLGFWLYVDASGIFKGIEQETLRLRYLARGELASKAPVVYVDLDAATVSYMGDRPWNRREFAVLLQSLIELGGAKVVAVDIILSKFGAGALLDWERARAGDALLGRVIDMYSDQIVLAAAYTGVKHSLTDEVARLPLIREGNYFEQTNTFPEAPTYPIVQSGVGRLGLANVDESLGAGEVPYFVPGFVELSGPRYSLHIIDGARRDKSHFMNGAKIVTDGDEIILTDDDGWNVLALPKEQELTLFTLGLEAYLAANDLDASSVEIGSDRLKINRDSSLFREIPLVDSQSIEVNWMQGWDTSTAHGRYSMQAVIRQAHAYADARVAEDVPRVAELESWFQRFEDKVIFVGPVDPMLKDLSPTPYNREPVPRVGLHANLYRMIDAEAYMMRASPKLRAVIIIMLTVIVVFCAAAGRALRVISFVLLAGYCAGVFLAFAQLNWILPLITPFGSSLTAAMAIILIKLGSEEWQRRRIKSLFGAYVSPALVNEMLESQQDPKLGGSESEITALFSDVEGFSALSEELSPDQLVSLMNEYLGAMTEVFQAQAGTLDKYIGDAIVTMFGMPLPVADHAARACRSAIEMQQRHAELREKWAQSEQWPTSVHNMRTRIGLNSGIAVIGNMGSEMRFNYTMMGDAVNLASRCESGAKTYGVYTMITDNTLQSALAHGEVLNYRKLDRIIVKGRAQPVDIYELWEPSVYVEAVACKQAYEAGLELYFAGEWTAALDAFEQAQPLEPYLAFAHITPSLLLAKRCRQFVEYGSPPDWDGVFKMQTK